VAARHKRRTVGYGSLVAYDRLGWIGFMGTEPAMQGRGIGAAVLRHLLRLAEGLGLKTLKLDATNIGQKLYTKFGFRVEYPARRCEIPGMCTRGTRRESPGGRVEIADRIPKWCLSLDRRAFGDDRSPLIAVALRHGGKLLMVDKKAFGLLDGKKLGPVVATDPDAAISVVRFGSSLGASVIYVPFHSELPRRFSAGLRLPEDDGPITCCTRMHRGDVVEQELGLAYADYSAATG
jgi:ribosomal protein S18 acetylase RimI-like enzyme